MIWDQARIPPSGGGLMNWLDSRVRTRLRVLAMTVLSWGWLGDLDIVGWSSLSLSEDVYADGDGEDDLWIFFSLLPCCLESDRWFCSRSAWTSAFSRSISLISVIMLDVCRI